MLYMDDTPMLVAHRDQIKAERDKAALDACMAIAVGDQESANKLAWKAVALDEEYRAREY